jgi:YidC/Oxa1 family membrane protein insertase
MQALQPQMAALKKQYGNDRQKLSEETMKLYRETGTNPLSSCLPIIVQAPFFYALFHVLSYVSNNKQVGVLTEAEVASFHSATVFGAPIYETFTKADSVHVKVVAIVMILLMSASTFITQRQLMVKNMPLGVDNPMAQQQKILLYVYPVFFAIFGINFPIGTLIYWLTTNLWTMGQQFYVIRRNPTPGSAAYEELMARRKEHEKTKRAEAIEAGTAEPEPEPPPVRRQQPKRQSRSQRKRPTTPGGSGATPPANDPNDTDEEAS